MNVKLVIETSGASAIDRCSAVGVSETYWFIAVVKNNTEFSVQTKLEEKGYEVYVPYQNKMVITPSGRKRVKKAPIIPTIVFIRCTEQHRMDIVQYPFINRFMVDRTGSKDAFNRSLIAKIPTAQIEKLKFMAGNSDEDIVIESLSIRLGDEVEVIRGGLKGLVGNVEEINNETRILIRIDALGYAGVKINSSDIKIIMHKL